MKERDLIGLQEKADNQKLYLIKVGMFYHAYNAGAYAIAKLMHYKIKRKHRKEGDILVAGFPVANLQNVICSIRLISMMSKSNLIPLFRDYLFNF